MSRLVSVCLCAIVAVVSMAGAALLGPAPALAASGTLTMETPLHEAPNHGSPLVALLHEGAVVSIDGPPVDGFYPVSTDGLSGWMRGETLELAKDVIEEPADAAATTEEPMELAPIEQEASGVPLTAAELAPAADQASDPTLTGEPPADPAMAVDPVAVPAPASEPAAAPSQTGEAVTDPAPAAEPVAETPVAAPADGAVPPAVDTWVSTDPAGAPVTTDSTVAPESTGLTGAPVTTEPAPGDANGEPAPESVNPGAVSAEPVVVEPAPAEMAATEPAPAPVPSPAPATEAAPAPDNVEAVPAADAAAIVPAPEPLVTPLPVPAPTPLGPAGVVVDMPIRGGPGPDYGLIFTVPMGSTVEQTGQVVDGFISVQYKEVSGWAAAEHMTEPSDFAGEAPEETAEPVDTRTPKPGSGVAFATIDLSLRSGPSANAEPVVVVPAGSKLVLTGVMEGNFQRVTYGDEVGWIANEYLETPESPAPNGEARGKQENYARREIVRYITQAAKRYDQSPDDMLRVAQCESNLDPYAVNPSGSYGLFQFIRSTWKSTPYGNEDIFDPQANANAAAWMWSQGRKSEWVCQ